MFILNKIPTFSKTMNLESVSQWINNNQYYSRHLMLGGRHLLTFSAFRMGAYWRWALIRGWALIRINTVNKRDSKRNSSNFALDKFWTRERSILFRTNEAIKKSVGTLLSRQTSLLNDLNKMHRSDRVCSELFTFPNFPRLSPWPSPVFHDLLSFKTKSRLWYTVCIYIF